MGPGVVTTQEIVAVPQETESAPVESALVVAVKLEPEMVQKKIQDICREIVVADEELELDAPFMGAGMDSLAGIQFSSDVGKAFGVSLSPTAIFEYPDIRSMVDHIVEESS